MLVPGSAGLAQLVERQLPKLNVAGSNPVPRSKISRVFATLNRTKHNGRLHARPHLGKLGDEGSAHRVEVQLARVVGVLVQLPAVDACAKEGPAHPDSMQARRLNFLRNSPWDDRSARREAARYAIEALEKQEPVTAWIVDDTGFVKQGKHSVGVQRQYTGTLGKICNCQVGVSLTIATSHEHVPIDFALYMPESWTDDAVRREKAKVPDALVFKTKPELALDLITRAVEDKLPGEIVLADAAYGNSSDFRKRWRTERAYEALKVELGLEHFEGRSFPGWHHHVSVVLCCYAFIVSERVRHFSPSARRRGEAHALAVAVAA